MVLCRLAFRVVQPRICRNNSLLVRDGLRRVTLASFPGPARSSLAVRNSLRGPGLVRHVMSATVVFLRHQMPCYLYTCTMEFQVETSQARTIDYSRKL